MTGQKTVVLLLAVGALACGPGSGAPPRQADPMLGAPGPSQAMLDEAAADLEEVRAGFLAWYFETHPVRASELGVHDHDGRLPALDRASVQDRIDDLLTWLSDLEQVTFDFMEGADRYDYAIMEYGIRSELLMLEEVRQWVADPEHYTSIIARGLAVVADRDYAPATDRATSLAARLGEVPAVLEAAQSNLRQPPSLWTESAVEATRSLIPYVEALPDRLAAQAGGSLGSNGLEAAADAAARALEQHARWLEDDLRPRSTGSYRLGRYLLERQLLYAEHVSLGLEELQRVNRDAMEEYRQKLETAAREIDPDRSPRSILDSIGAAHPGPDSLLAAAAAAVERVRDRVMEAGVVEVPHAGVPTVRESPPFRRDEPASLDAPGPYDEPGLEAFYNVTAPADGWSDERADQHLSQLSGPFLTMLALRETFPGRYVQRQYARDVTELRRVYTADSFADGWAEYAAEMALDEGVVTDPAVRLVQYWSALRRHARWFAVVRLHGTNEPLDDVVAAVMEIAHLDEATARSDVLRATRDPLLMAASLGRLQIHEVRDDYRAWLEERDEAFSLQEFHRRLLRTGLPFPLAREELMPREPLDPRRTR